MVFIKTTPTNVIAFSGWDYGTANLASTALWHRALAFVLTLLTCYIIQIFTLEVSTCHCCLTKPLKLFTAIPLSYFSFSKFISPVV